MSNSDIKKRNNTEWTRLLSEDLFEIQHLSKSDVDQLQLLILDYFAASFAGYKENKEFNEAIEKTLLSKGGAEESYILLQHKRHPADTAAFINAVYAHGAELDDGHKRASGHAGVHIIPATFALADKLGSCNQDVLIALATGYEAFIRISAAAQPGIIRRGFHSTGVTGTLAVAAACARLYHLDSEGIENAIALATTMTGGLLSYGDSRPAIKPLNPAKATENGMLAAMLASEGVKGPTESLEGRNGWFHAFTDSVDEKQLEGTDRLLLHDCYFKLYPSCRHTHCGIDAARELHSKIKAEDIRQITVNIYPDAIRLAGIKIPTNKDETKFSIFYTIARALISGNYGLSDMNIDNLTPKTIELIEKINLVPDDSMEDREQGIRGAKVSVVENSGVVFEETVVVPKGDPENPVTHGEIEEKFRECASGVYSESEQKKLIKEIKNISGDRIFSNPLRNVTSVR